MKQKISYSCTNCSYRPPKWVGCCPECNEWNSIIGQEIVKKAGFGAARSANSATLVTLTEITSHQNARMISGLGEWDRVVGGGIMPASFLIVTGDPGIGKSTLLLQIAHRLSLKHRVIYFSCEESLEQVKLRAERLDFAQGSLLFSDQATLESVVSTGEQEKPDLIIVDSIQNCYSSTAQTIPGSVGQLREAAFTLMRLAKEQGVAVLVSGHITKEGEIAGPKLLEHMVDGVFYLQGEDRWQTRILRSVKNRFGRTNELGFFTMDEQGLVELPNINQTLLDAYTPAPGSALISYLEGSRPLLLELQALTIPSKFGIPQRVITGIDQKRVLLIAAILEKYLHIKLSTHDLFFKISGGFTVKESSADLGIALTLLSSHFAQALPEKVIALGEINLTGHIKPINNLTIHSNEARTFGIKKILVSKQQAGEQPATSLIRFSHVYELLNLFDQSSALCRPAEQANHS